MLLGKEASKMCLRGPLLAAKNGLGGPLLAAKIGLGGPLLAAKIGLGGPLLAAKIGLGWDHFWQGGTTFGCQKWSPGTTFGMTGHQGRTQDITILSIVYNPDHSILVADS